MSMPQQVPDPSDYHLSEPDREWEMLALACDIAATKCILCDQFGHTHYDCPDKMRNNVRITEVPTPPVEAKKNSFWAGFWPESWT